MTAKRILPDRIYHLSPLGAFLDGLAASSYSPASLSSEGFVHATVEPSVVLAVARDYFAACEEPLLLLTIDITQLSAPVRLEAPAPLPGGREHLQLTRQFPHIYGPVDRPAIVGVAIMPSVAEGYAWPTEWLSVAAFLQSHAEGQGPC